MKRMLVPLFLIVAVSSNAQPDTTVLQFAKLPDSTGFGTPDGNLISKEIGVAGGSIASDDGRVELIFPAEAFPSNTVISIQPITNPLLSGTGKAYNFEPSGVHFEKPVQIVFRYTKEESETCPAGLMNLAMQDHTGKWTFNNYDQWDSTKKTLTGSINHFSSMANSNGFQIKPENKETIVGGTVNINLLDRYGTVQSGPFIGNRDRIAIGDRYWAVNDVKFGNDQVGYAGPPALSISLGTYTAPKIIPKRRNPVVISFFFEYYSEIMQQNLWGVVSCKIEVFDQYKVELIHAHAGRASMKSELYDKGSFVVTIRAPEKFEIEDIKNYPPTVIKEGRRGQFKEKVLTDGAQGSIHVESSIQYKSLSDDHFPKVHFEFKQKESLLCKLQHSGRGAVGEPTMIFTIAIPEAIQFIANGEAQDYTGTTVDGEPYKLHITPVGRTQSN